MQYEMNVDLTLKGVWIKKVDECNMKLMSMGVYGYGMNMNAIRNLNEYECTMKLILIYH